MKEILLKLDGWVTQTVMYLRAYDVDLTTVRAVDVATMFLRGKAQDWWTGQFHLQESGMHCTSAHCTSSCVLVCFC
jgi:hypothetical protein